MAEELKVIAFVQLDSGTVYPVYDFPLARVAHDVPRPLPCGQGMTDEQVRDAHEAYLRHLAHDE